MVWNLYPQAAARLSCAIWCSLVLYAVLASQVWAGQFEQQVKPILVARCQKCHGGDEINAMVDFRLASSEAKLLEQPQLIREMIQVVEANAMPPEGEAPLEGRTRSDFLATLRDMLRRTVNGQPTTDPVRRLNRFQYNYAVRDLFQLNRNVFALPEKLLTRHDNYLQLSTERMPAQVRASSSTLRPPPGLRGVHPFPKDLRAAHGFDNQANQLTLSPLLLDAFLRLSVSIVESEDFNEANVGIWQDFFAEPPSDGEVQAVIHRRVQEFLTLAFRRHPDEAVVARYVQFATEKIEQGESYTSVMKRVASAALSSPLFLYRGGTDAEDEAAYHLASKLSFFLWSSGPDRELLELARNGRLRDPEVLTTTVQRMMRDAKIERFLDSFPAQWMQLENLLAATPDPEKQRLFSLDKEYPASLQMMVEPLLLFDAVFIEDRPIRELILPEFGYQSDFLQHWYTSDLSAPRVDAEAIGAQNARNDQRRSELQQAIEQVTSARKRFVDPVREQLLTERKRERGPAVGLKPIAAWEFDGDLQSSVGEYPLTAHGNVRFEDGYVWLEKSFLQSTALPKDLKAKSLEIWFKIANLDQRGGGLMGIQGPGDFFDTIVLGERQPRHWISGSNGFSRTEDFPESTEETQGEQPIHLLMVYEEDGTTRLYRNGVPYGKPYRKGQATFPAGKTSVLFGLRHLPAGGNKFLNVAIDRARLYDRALTSEEVQAAKEGGLYVSNDDIRTAMDDESRAMLDDLEERLTQLRGDLKSVPANRDPAQVQQQRNREFDDAIRAKLRDQVFRRVAVKDPRYGGIITNAAMLSMTSGPRRTHPIARGAWMIEVIFNDPPPPPPNDVPPLNEDAADERLTIREKFAAHRENPDCAGCHSRLDPLGFALENFDITGRWRDTYENGRDVDVAGTLMRKYDFANIVEFKQHIAREDRRFAEAFVGHLLRYALTRELQPKDLLAVEEIAQSEEVEGYRLRQLIQNVVLSDAFTGDLATGEESSTAKLR